ncbi:MAG: tail fiber domain-containing protein [Pseudomonadota bacterium]
MKRILLSATISIALVSGQAHAGGMAEPMMEPEVIVEEAAASSGGFVVPLILLALVALAIASDNDDADEPVLVSDLRLKTDVTRVGIAENGLALYQYRYLGTGPVFEGVMAQDVIAQYPDAIVPMPGGYMAVDYGMLGLEMKRID